MPSPAARKICAQLLSCANFKLTNNFANFQDCLVIFQSSTNPNIYPTYRTRLTNAPLGKP